MTIAASFVRVAAALDLPEGALVDRLRWDAIELSQDEPPGGLNGWQRRRAAQSAGSASRPAGWAGSAGRLDDRALGGDGRGERPAGWDDLAWRLDGRALGGDGRVGRPAGWDDRVWRLDDRALGVDGRGGRPAGWDDPVGRKGDRAGYRDDQVARRGDRALRRAVRAERRRACQSLEGGPQEGGVASSGAVAIPAASPKPDSSIGCSSPNDCSRSNRPARRCQTPVRLERRSETRVLNRRQGRRSAQGWLGRCK